MKQEDIDKIAKLREAIESDATPEHIKANMKARIKEIEEADAAEEARKAEEARIASLPPPPPPPKEKVKRKQTILPHQEFIEENSIIEADLPLTIRRKIAATKLPLGAGKNDQAIKQSEAIILLLEPLVKPKQVVPSPIPPKERTEEELEAIIESRKARKETRKQKLQEID